MNDVSSQLSTGTIQVDTAESEPCIRLRWDTTSIAGEVLVSDEGGPEKLISSDRSGSIEIDWIQPGKSYVFRLYDPQSSRRLINEVTVCKAVLGNLTFKPKADAIEGTIELQCSITTPVVGEIYLSEDGGPERLVWQGTTDTVEVGGLGAGIEYVFRLYADTKAHPLLDELPFFREIEGTISIDYEATPFRIDTKAHVRWWLIPPVIGEIYLSEDGQAERLVCRGKTDTVEVGGLGAGIGYVFRLYADTKAHPLLDEVQFFREIEGVITANPNPIPLEAGSATTLHWQVTSPIMAEVCIAENGAGEKIVCRGASGSFEMSALQGGIDYRFSLYSYPGPRNLLDEVTVKLAEIPWSALSERFKGGRTDSYSRSMAEFLGVALPGCLHHEEFPEWFHLWERNGVHLTPVHFYEPIPDSTTLAEDLWKRPGQLSGVQMNESTQRHLLCDVFPSFRSEYQQIPLQPTDDPSSFYLRNGRFEGLDPLIAYCMTRHFKPRQIIEVGSGYSTLILAQAARVNLNTELHSVEPYPEEFLSRGVLGLTSLLAKKVEEIELSFFDTLKEGDFLFIDTSHVVRIGGDVNFLFLQVLPQLNPGVFVHVHDIFLPYEYPKEWVLSRRRFWTEQYLLQAFLCHNSKFEVLVSSAYLSAYFPDRLKEVFPTCESWGGGSFWMRKT